METLLNMRVFLSTIVMIIATINSSFAADATIGKKIYVKCIACHFIDNDKNKIGPSLQNIIDRQAGSHPKYIYSSAMIEAGKNGLIWTKDNLKKYLHSPHKMVKGTKMFGVNLKSDKDIDDLIEYLAEHSKKS